MVSFRQVLVHKTPIKAKNPGFNTWYHRRTTIVHDYLLRKEPEYARFVDVRGELEAADIDLGPLEPYTLDPIAQASLDKDGIEIRGIKHFLRMKAQARQIQRATGIFRFPEQAARIFPRFKRDGSIKGRHPMALDICMAPGAFTVALFFENPGVLIRGITLDESQGGHPVRRFVFGDWTDTRGTVQIEKHDVTMLAGEMGISPEEVPETFPWRDRLSFERPFLQDKFELVICDGQLIKVLTEGVQQTQRNLRATRLIYSQLVFALQRVKQNGTLLIYMHEIEEWSSVKLLYYLSRIAKLSVCKPAVGVLQAMEPTFYLIARDVDIESEAATQVLKEFQGVWKWATFQVNGPSPENHELLQVTDVLERFGEQLVELGRPVWKAQADAIEQFPTHLKAVYGAPVTKREERALAGLMEKVTEKRFSTLAEGGDLGQPHIRKYLV